MRNDLSGTDMLRRDFASIEKYAEGNPKAQAVKNPPSGFFAELDSRLEALFRVVQDVNYTAHRIRSNLVGGDAHPVSEMEEMPTSDASLVRIDRLLSRLSDEINDLNKELNTIEAILGRAS